MSEEEIYRRFDALEKRLDKINIANNSGPYSIAVSKTDEIDLRELWNILWRGKWWILCITLLFAVAGFLFSLSLPVMYKSEGIYAPAQKQGDFGLAGQFGGLASLAGVSLTGKEGNDFDQAMVLITSWPFLEKVIDKHELKPLIMGVNSWDRETRELIWNDKVYDPSKKKWTRKPPEDKEAEPSSFEAYFGIKRMIGINYNAKTSMLSVSVEHYSPDIAKKWVEMLVEEINNSFRERSIAESKKNIDFLEKRVAETSIAEMQTVFYGMVESQMKTLMLAEVGDEFLLKEVVPPKVAEERSRPAKLLIFGFFTVIGGMSSLLLVVLVGLISRPKSAG